MNGKNISETKLASSRHMNGFKAFSILWLSYKMLSLLGHKIIFVTMFNLSPLVTQNFFFILHRKDILNLS